MDFLITLISTYGYLMVFVGTLLEGETIVALAGLAAYQGHLDMRIIIPVAVVGAVIGDHAFFYFGRYKGRTMLLQHPEWNDRIAKIHGWLHNHQNLLIFGSRFLYGFRMITPVVLGTSKVSGLRFFILNVLGALCWASIFTLGGYTFGTAIESFLGNMKKFEGLLVAAVITVALFVHVFFWWRRRTKKLAECEKMLHVQEHIL